MKISVGVPEIIRHYPFLRNHVADFTAERGVSHPILPDDEAGRPECFTEPFPESLFSSRIRATRGRLYVVQYQEPDGQFIVTVLPQEVPFQMKKFPGMTHLVHKYRDDDDELVIKIIGLGIGEGEQTPPAIDSVPA
ncbi:MAG TPA: hypothetical protein VJJ73_01685 [Candidatus Paceibacterota bacterium]